MGFSGEKDPEEKGYFISAPGGYFWRQTEQDWVPCRPSALLLLLQLWPADRRPAFLALHHSVHPLLSSGSSQSSFPFISEPDRGPHGHEDLKYWILIVWETANTRTIGTIAHTQQATLMGTMFCCLCFPNQLTTWW